MKPGKYNVQWQGTGPEIQVSFVQNGKTVATVPGTWDAGNGIPRRAFLGDFSVNGGSGISITQASDGTQNVAVDTTVARTGQPFVVEGANAYMGVASLTAGTVTVSTTAVAANSRIFLTLQDCTANAGTPSTTSRRRRVSRPSSSSGRRTRGGRRSSARSSIR